MVATPAWPPKTLPRLYIAAPLTENASIELDSGQSNYLANVLRMEVGAELLTFDGRSGEWLGRVVQATKKRVTLTIERQVHEAEEIPDVWLAFAPVKRAQVDWLVEKATELGVARLIPVITQRTVVERVKLERLETIAIEAAEQCGRTVLPQISEPVALAKLLEQRDGPRQLYFADENGGEPAAQAFVPGSAMILTGPEGGFTEQERAAVRGTEGTTPISLGPRVLRAETAALAALASWMAVAGDWSSAR